MADQSHRIARQHHDCIEDVPAGASGAPDVGRRLSRENATEQEKQNNLNSIERPHIANLDLLRSTLSFLFI